MERLDAEEDENDGMPDSDSDDENNDLNLNTGRRDWSDIGRDFVRSRLYCLKFPHFVWPLVDSRCLLCSTLLSSPNSLLFFLLLLTPHLSVLFPRKQLSVAVRWFDLLIFLSVCVSIALGIMDERTRRFDLLIVIFWTLEVKHGSMSNGFMTILAKEDVDADSFDMLAEFCQHKCDSNTQAAVCKSELCDTS